MKRGVAYAVDGNYLLPLAVALRSLSDTLPPEAPPLDVFILHSEAAASGRGKVEAALGGESPLRLHWLQIRQDPVAGLPYGLHFSSANYFRLLLPELLPPDLSHVLYLDADTVVRRSIFGLLELYDPIYPLQACLDYTGTIGNPLIQLESPAAFGLAPDAPYFNSGVLFLNLETWRREGLAARVIEFAQKHPEALRMVDQTAINIVLHGRIGRLPDHWNAQTVHPNVLNGSWGIPYLPQDLGNASLIHYTSEVKPWSSGKNLPQAAPFLEVRQRIHWD